jgi:hypothetical protein
MPHRFEAFTNKKITNATITNVINATKKSPIPNNCPA